MEVLYKSQIKKVDLSNDQEVECDPEKRKIINEAILDCILIDSRPFSDFSKPGMIKLIDVIIPGYKPPSRTTIYRRLESEFIKYKKKKDLKMVHLIIGQFLFHLPFR